MYVRLVQQYVNLFISLHVRLHNFPFHFNWILFYFISYDMFHHFLIQIRTTKPHTHEYTKWLTKSRKLFTKKSFLLTMETPRPTNNYTHRLSINHDTASSSFRFDKSSLIYVWESTYATKCPRIKLRHLSKTNKTSNNSNKSNTTRSALRTCFCCCSRRRRRHLCSVLVD